MKRGLIHMAGGASLKMRSDVRARSFHKYGIVTRVGGENTSIDGDVQVKREHLSFEYVHIHKTYNIP